MPDGTQTFSQLVPSQLSDAQQSSPSSQSDAVLHVPVPHEPANEPDSPTVGLSEQREELASLQAVGSPSPTMSSQSDWSSPESDAQQLANEEQLSELPELEQMPSTQSLGSDVVEPLPAMFLLPTLPPHHGDAMTGFWQHNWPVSVEQSLSLWQLFTHSVAQTPAQQSSDACVLQSESAAHVLAHVAAGWQRPVMALARLELSAEVVGQQASPTAVSQLALVVHGVGHSSVVVQIGSAKLPQHLGVPLGHSASAVHDVRQAAVGAQTVAVVAVETLQHDCPSPVLHWLSLLQKTGHAAGATHDEP